MIDVVTRDVLIDALHRGTAAWQRHDLAALEGALFDAIEALRDELGNGTKNRTDDLI